MINAKQSKVTSHSHPGKALGGKGGLHPNPRLCALANLSPWAKGICHLAKRSMRS